MGVNWLQNYGLMGPKDGLASERVFMEYRQNQRKNSFFGLTNPFKMDISINSLENIFAFWPNGGGISKNVFVGNAQLISNIFRTSDSNIMNNYHSYKHKNVLDD